ncbi:MAG: carbamoyltransferase HypF [Azonexus sp.]|nr:carbamoyltransferase HypF [Azonexus sp.]
MNGRLIRVRGLVQGVGFRPYVWQLAHELGLSGWVRNDGGGVSIAISGGNVDRFIARLPAEQPKLARIDSIEVDPLSTLPEPGFVILDSEAGSVATAIGPDAAICPDCVADICDPDNRRWRYAFTTCTHCGPRYTVSQRIPYDRAQTSLAGFPLCVSCQAEYVEPRDRRFHAETTCCPACGPSLELLDAGGNPLPGDPLAETIALLRVGKIVAIKGLGGFHLACDARNAEAVAVLRQRKQREEKPFAVMGLNQQSLSSYAEIDPAVLALLQSTAAPIVLCPKAALDLPGVAPELGWLGVMLPTTPVHLLLWHAAQDSPAGTDWLNQASELLLVMTSANPHGEALVIDNSEALNRLSGIADAFLMHNRDIVVRCDDSVVRSGSDFGPAFIRRARGFTPVPIALASDGPCVLALGAYLKNTVCVLKGKQAFLSQHIGSLDNASAIGFLEETVAHLLDILEVKPDLIAHDLHPDFHSTRLALRLAAEWQIPAVAVGHHQAHIGAICAEHQLDEPVLGLAIDGVGLGPDGGLWGGELLRVDGAQCLRLGHLAPLLLPGGDRAAREPWRMAASALHACGRSAEIPAFLVKRFPGRDGKLLTTMLERGLNCPPTSSLGRLFDAASGLLGLRAEARYEGQAAMELECIAAAHGVVEAMPDGMRLNQGIADFTPLLSRLADCDDPAYGAALFHATLAEGLSRCVNAIPQGDFLRGAVYKQKTAKIIISGGCAMNAVLMTGLRQALQENGLTVFEAQQAPPNDGGLALGQAWVARNWLE